MRKKNNFTGNNSNLTTPDVDARFCPNVITTNQQVVQYISYGICIPIIAAVGILVNIASLIVLTRPSMRSSVYVYLAGLSFFDGLVLLLSLLNFPSLVHCEIACFDSASFWCRYTMVTMPITYPTMNIAQTGSIWTLTAITVDRFVAITWPLKSRELLTVRRALVVLVVIAVCSVLYNIPLFFELELKDDGQLGATALREDLTYITVYKSYCYLFFMFVIPALIMFVLNVFVTLAVKNAYKVRRQLSGRDEKDRRCTLLTILVVSAFLVLNLTANISNCVEAFNPDNPELASSLRSVFYIGNLLVTVNSAINFFIYALSLRFRQMFCKLFCPLCYTPEKEYQFLSAYFGSHRGGSHANGTDVAGGIISMRSLRKPLITSPRSSVTQRDGGRISGKTNSVNRYNNNNNTVNSNANSSYISNTNPAVSNGSSPNALAGAAGNNSGRITPMKVDFSQRNKNLVSRRPPAYD